MSRNCLGCGRYLPSLESQRRGYGEKCLRRRREQLLSQFKPVQRDKAQKLRKARALSRVKSGVYRVRSGSSVYLTAREACTCPSGKYRPLSGSCYHQAAVRIQEA